jgi:nitrate/nitrite-specific signal transduction histidine kinase
MRVISVSTKIKVIGLLLISSIFIVIGVTIMLNQKNVTDALIINIAGKQRMLTQKMTKNIFYLYQNQNGDFLELDKSIDQFNYGLVVLTKGDELLKISAAPTKEIAMQLSKVSVIWKTFEANIKEFRSALSSSNTSNLHRNFNYIKATNNELLEEVDKVVTLYSQYIEEKTDFIKKFQYAASAFMFFFALYSLIQLKQIEEHAREFIEKYKKISSNKIDELEPIALQNSEKEFVEMANDMNCFIHKVNSVMDYSKNALEQSEIASKKLEGLTSEFGNIIDDLENKSEVLSNIDRSEDIAIETSENLLKTTKQLNDLKSQLDQLLLSCKNT